MNTTAPGVPHLEPDRRYRTLSRRSWWVLSPRFKRSRDVVAGIVLPLVCLYFDPVLFRGEMAPLGPNYVAFSYTLIGASMAAFASRLVLSRGSPFLAGAMAAGVVFASALAIVLLPVVLLVIVTVPPVSLEGIVLFAVAMLGTAPALVAYIYFCAAKETWLEAKDLPRMRARSSVFAGFMSTLALAALVEWSIRTEFDRAINMASEGKTLGKTELTAVRLLAWGNQADAIVKRYTAEGDPRKREHLATLYRLITRQDIEIRIEERRD